MPPRQEQTPPPLPPDDVQAGAEAPYSVKTYVPLTPSEVPSTPPPPAPPTTESATLFQLPKQKKRPPINSAQIATKFTRRFRLG